MTFIELWLFLMWVWFIIVAPFKEESFVSNVIGFTSVLENCLFLHVWIMMIQHFKC